MAKRHSLAGVLIYLLAALRRRRRRGRGLLPEWNAAPVSRSVKLLYLNGARHAGPCRRAGGQNIRLGQPTACVHSRDAPGAGRPLFHSLGIAASAERGTYQPIRRRISLSRGKTHRRQREEVQRCTNRRVLGCVTVLRPTGQKKSRCGTRDSRNIWIVISPSSAIFLGNKNGDGTK